MILYFITPLPPFQGGSEDDTAFTTVQPERLHYLAVFTTSKLQEGRDFSSQNPSAPRLPTAPAPPAVSGPDREIGGRIPPKPPI